jgi:hypothetical protein
MLAAADFQRRTAASRPSNFALTREKCRFPINDKALMRLSSEVCLPPGTAFSTCREHQIQLDFLFDISHTIFHAV